MSETNGENCFNQMINKIANKQNVYFKSQQKDETDLTLNEKQIIVKNLFDTNKQLFLQRYGWVLSDEELNCFHQFNDNSDIDCLLKTLKESNSRNKKRSVVKNRRFEALQRLIREGDYFSDTQMKTRNPLLFHKMIGQYMTEEERTQLTNEKYFQNHERVTLSSFLLEQMDNNYIEDKLNAQNVEEFDSDSDDSDDGIEEDIQTEKFLEESEKLKLREEFTKYMTEEFLSGKDTEFYDYSQCDHNIDFDCNQINERDIEEKYFDED